MKTVVLCTALVALIGFTALPDNANDLYACGCEQPTALNTAFPVSHSVNRCAAKVEAEVSWLSWITGNSYSYQFHFLDLLELLSRNSDNYPQRP